jgi:uncharacterized protein DUF4232
MERHNSGVGRQEGSELAIGLVLLVVMTAGVAVLSSSEGAVERTVAPGVGQASSSTTRFGGGPPWWPALPRGSEGSFTTATVPATSPTTRETTATARACRVFDLRVTLEGSQGAGGTRYTPLAFKNWSSSRCALTGHPKVSFLDRSGRVIGQATSAVQEPTAVTVAPGEVASATIGVTSQSLADCQPVTPATLRVVLPGGGAVSVAVPTKGAFEPGGADFRFCPGENPSFGPFQK